MARVVWTDTALSDLQRHTEYIRKDSPNNAGRGNRRLREAVKVLSRFPEIGALVPELNIPTIRELLVYSYRIIYEVRENECEVLFIFHGSRDLKRFLDLPDDEGVEE